MHSGRAWVHRGAMVYWLTVGFNVRWPVRTLHSSRRGGLRMPTWGVGCQGESGLVLWGRLRCAASVTVCAGRWYLADAFGVIR